MSWRSSKSTADSRSFAILYAVSKPWRRSCKSSRSRVATSSSAACSTAETASEKAAIPLTAAASRGTASSDRSSSESAGDRERDELERALEHRPRRLTRLVLQGLLCEAAQLRDAFREHALPAGRKVERETRGAQAFEDADEHRLQPARAIRREQLQPLGHATATERGQRVREGFGSEHASLALVEHPEPRIEPSLERVGTKEPEAKPVNRRDPGSVDLAGEISPAELPQPRSDPLLRARPPPAPCT